MNSVSKLWAVAYVLLIVLSLNIRSCSRTFSQQSIKKIVVIDSGIKNEFPKEFLCENLSKVFVTDSMDAGRSDHGTVVASILSDVMNVNKYCLVILKIYGYGNESNKEAMLLALEYTLTLNPYLVNISMSGDDPIEGEEVLLKRLVGLGTKVVIAAGNNGRNLNVKCDVYPACYQIKEQNFYVIGASDSSQSNKNGPVDFYMSGLPKRYLNYSVSGTSAATAEFSATLIQKDQ